MTDGPLEGWHLDKRVNVGHMATTLITAIAVVVFLIRLEGQIALNAQAINTNTRDIVRNNQDVKDDLADIKLLLRRIEDKVDGEIRRPFVQ